MMFVSDVKQKQYDRGRSVILRRARRKMTQFSKKIPRISKKSSRFFTIGKPTDILKNDELLM